MKNEGNKKKPICVASAIFSAINRDIEGKIKTLENEMSYLIDSRLSDLYIELYNDHEYILSWQLKDDLNEGK